MKAYSVAVCYAYYCRRRDEGWFEAPILNAGDSHFCLLGAAHAKVFWWCLLRTKELFLQGLWVIWGLGV